MFLTCLLCWCYRLGACDDAQINQLLICFFSAALKEKMAAHQTLRLCLILQSNEAFASVMKPTWHGSNYHFHFVTFQIGSRHSHDSRVKAARSQYNCTVKKHSCVEIKALFPKPLTHWIRFWCWRRIEPSKTWLSAHSQIQLYYSWDEQTL